MEIWATIEGFEAYAVSNHGRVKNIVTGHVLKPTRNCPRGETEFGPRVTLYRRDGKGTSRGVHWLVATAFVDNPDNSPHAQHIDGDVDNNAAWNLGWCHHQCGCCTIGRIIDECRSAAQQRRFEEEEEELRRQLRREERQSEEQRMLRRQRIEDRKAKRLEKRNRGFDS